jgi:hypothetical protein
MHPAWWMVVLAWVVGFGDALVLALWLGNGRPPLMEFLRLLHTWGGAAADRLRDRLLEGPSPR